MADPQHKRRRTARSKTANKVHGRPSRTDSKRRTVAVGVATGFGAIAAIVAGFAALTRRRGGGAEHEAPDLAPDKIVGSERAPEAFRPDPTAPVPESEREALRPATGPAPSLVATAGEMANQTGAANG